MSGMPITRVINCHKDKNPNAVYIGRGSIFGNPYSHQDKTKALFKVSSREEAIEKYRAYLYDKILHEPDFRLRLIELEGCTLACYCKPLACHGDVIVRAIQWLRSLKEISPLTDGINHINVYSKGITIFGQRLSNFAQTPFVLPEHGSFQSIEGYWYWLSTKDDKLRELHGYEAKTYGREIRGADWPKDEDFKRCILEAIRAKIDQNKYLQHYFRYMAAVGPLPFKHYYVQAGAVVYPKEGCQWILDEFDSIQQQYLVEEQNAN